MITKDKVTEIFCIIDEFCKHFDAENAQKVLISSKVTSRRRRSATMSDSEIMTILLLCHNLRRYANKVFKGIATDGKGTMGWCHGFKLHLACNDRGEIIAFVLTGANVSDKDPEVFKVLAKRLYGKLFADKGYISQRLFDILFEDGIQLVTGLRVNMKNKLMPFYDRMMLRKR